MNTIQVSNHPMTNNNTLVVNFTTDASDIKDILISKDGGETYISATSFTDTSAFFNYIMDFIVVLMDGVDVTNEYVTPIVKGEEGGSTENLFMITAINPIDINENYATGELVSDRGLGITDLTVPKNKPFDILYYTGEPAVKHEISWDFGNTYQDKTNMAIRVTYADGSIDCKTFTITFN